MAINKTVHTFLITALLFNSVIPLSGYIVTLFLLMYLICKGEIKNLIKQLLNQKILLYFIIYIIFILILSKYKIYSLFGTIILIMIIFIYLSIKTYEKSLTLSLSITKYFNIISIIISTLGILQYYFFRNIYFSPGWVDSSIYNINMRAYSTLLNPNVLAGFLLLCISFYIQDLEEIKKRKKSILSITLASYCLILTYSRGAWATLYVIILLAYFTRKRIIYLFYGGLFFITMLLINDSLAIERISLNNTLRDNSLFYRLEIYKTMIKIIKDNFIFGTGLNTMRFYINDYSSTIKAPVYHGHNLILNILGEGGFVGLLFFVIMMIKLIKTFVILTKIDNILVNKICFSCIFSLISVFIHGLVDAVILAPQFLFYVVFVYTIIFNLEYSLESYDVDFDDNKYVEMLFIGGKYNGARSLRFKKSFNRT